MKYKEPVIYYRGRGGANGKRVITFYATKKGRVTENLSKALEGATSCFVNIVLHLKQK